MDLKVERPDWPLTGSVRPGSDKSLTHRAYMLAASAGGDCVIRHPLRSADCERTLAALISLGAKVASIVPEQVRMRPVDPWKQPAGPVDCGNSGTTMRLLAGLIASRPLDVTLEGDASLSKRPMQRVAEPLRLMGATVEGDTPPLRIVGGALRGIEYATPVASAQVKSAILLAGLRATGDTWVSEPSLSRDHTERMLQGLGVDVKHRQTSDGTNSIGVPGGSRWDGFEFSVPADISSAAFFLVAAAMIPRSEITLEAVGINPTRTGVLDVLGAAGAQFWLSDRGEELHEPYGDLTIHSAESLRAFDLSGDLVPRVIDEIPILAVLATQCEGTSTFRDVGELRVKECDRIAVMADRLTTMGAEVETWEDGFSVKGPTPLHGARMNADGDHRIAMALAVAGLIAEGTTHIVDPECIHTSYPEFTIHLGALLEP